MFSKVSDATFPCYRRKEKFKKERIGIPFNSVYHLTLSPRSPFPIGRQE
jgi:hypothetical protein